MSPTNSISCPCWRDSRAKQKQPNASFLGRSSHQPSCIRVRGGDSSCVTPFDLFVFRNHHPAVDRQSQDIVTTRRTPKRQIRRPQAPLMSKSCRLARHSHQNRYRCSRRVQVQRERHCLRDCRRMAGRTAVRMHRMSLEMCVQTFPSSCSVDKDGKTMSLPCRNALLEAVALHRITAYRDIVRPTACGAARPSRPCGHAHACWFCGSGRG